MSEPTLTMFRLQDHLADRNRRGFSRRDFLRVGTLGLGGASFSLPWMLSRQARAAEGGDADVLRDRAVVLLFLQGGPPHIETFDPKMSAPDGVRSVRGEIRTSIPGITFGSDFPKLAAMAHKLAVVRSYGSKNAGHDNHVVVTGARNGMDAAMSALYSRIAGTNHPDTGMPRNTLVLPEAVKDGLKLESNFETNALPTLTSPGTLGAGYAAFNPSGGGELQRDMTLGIPPGRFDDRRGLLHRLDALRRKLDTGGDVAAMGKYEQQAYEIITRGIADAFDLSREDPRVLARYDTSGLFRMEEWTGFLNMRRTTNLLGRQMLLARRLCEAGCGFVTVSDCGWDLHADGNSAPGLDAMAPLGGQVDHAVAAFIEDLEARGLSEKILLIVTSEMGRTPRLNKNGGRDHYGELTPLLLYGGGLKMGQVIGQSDRMAEKPATRPYGPEHLLATVLHTLFDTGRLRLRTDLPREFTPLLGLDPIAELV